MRHVAVAVVVGLTGCDHVLGLFPVSATDGGGAGADAIAITATFGETGTTTYTGVTSDTYIDGGNPTFNFGAAHDLFVDSDPAVKVPLLRFDLSSLSTQANVIAASLRLTTKTDPSADTVSVVTVLESWEEGTVDTAAGTANWNERMAGVAWASPGAAPPSRETRVIGSFVPAAIATAYDIAIDPSVVATWVTDPSQNFGVALFDVASDGVTLGSSETSDLSARPVFTVVYTP